MATEQERQLFASKVLVEVGRAAVRLPELKAAGFMAMIGGFIGSTIAPGSGMLSSGWS